MFSPDQRGFGDTADRGYWPGTRALVDDAREMAVLLHHRYPARQTDPDGREHGCSRVDVSGRITADPPPVDGYILVAPAVWGRAEMNVFMRTGLWLLANMVPGMKVTGSIAAKVASDNREAIRRLSHGSR